MRARPSAPRKGPLWRTRLAAMIMAHALRKRRCGPHPKSHFLAHADASGLRAHRATSMAPTRPTGLTPDPVRGTALGPSPRHGSQRWGQTSRHGTTSSRRGGATTTRGTGNVDNGDTDGARNARAGDPDGSPSGGRDTPTSSSPATATPLREGPNPHRGPPPAGTPTPGRSVGPHHAANQPPGLPPWEGEGIRASAEAPGQSRVPVPTRDVLADPFALFWVEMGC